MAVGVVRVGTGAVLPAWTTTDPELLRPAGSRTVSVAVTLPLAVWMCETVGTELVWLGLPSPKAIATALPTANPVARVVRTLLGERA